MSVRLSDMKEAIKHIDEIDEELKELGKLHLCREIRYYDTKGVAKTINAPDITKAVSQALIDRIADLKELRERLCNEIGVYG